MFHYSILLCAKNNLLKGTIFLKSEMLHLRPVKVKQESVEILCASEHFHPIFMIMCRHVGIYSRRDRVSTFLPVYRKAKKSHPTFVINTFSFWFHAVDEHSQSVLTLLLVCRRTVKSGKDDQFGAHAASIICNHKSKAGK